jgi:GNAT superfamily N-acetyltransferase
MVRIPRGAEAARSEARARRRAALSGRSEAAPETREPAFLRDGTEVRVGRITPRDAALLADGFVRLSEESRRLRFLAPKPRLTQSELEYLTRVDGQRHEAIGAVDPSSGRGVAIARFVRDASDQTRAEVAVTVADDWQHRGLGKLMLTRLADRAREQGITHFTALVAVDNKNMHKLLERIDAPARVTGLRADVAEYEIELAPRGLGTQLEEALRAAAAGRLEVPPRICDALRALVPGHLRR